MSRGYSVPTLHQQDGGLSIQAFAEREGLTLGQVKRCIKAGKIIGARQDARSKHWTIYPPAKLTERPRSYAKPQEVFPEPSPHSQISAAAAAAQQKQAGVSAVDFGQHAPQVEAEGIHPPTGRVLEAAALPDAARTQERGTPASCGRLWIYTEARSFCQVLHDAAARQFREGLHYLRLDAREFAQLYAALDNDRSRLRKLVGRGVLPVGLLRASDSVWHKMQAMSREGRLL